MLVFLSEWLTKYVTAFNVVSYLSFRAVMAILTSLTISLLIGPKVIKELHKLKYGQVVRNDGPQSHLVKQGTPTMGGIMILGSIIVSILLWADLRNVFVWVILFATFAFGSIGFIDDYWKITRHNTKGLSAKWKYLWQSVFAIGIGTFIYFWAPTTAETTLVVPFFKNFMPDLGWLIIPFAYCVIVGSSNAVNLTDGLDGLAIVPTALVAAAFGLIAWVTGNVNYAEYLNIPYVKSASEVVIVCTAIVGASIGFLWFNTYPALVFMGDVGSLTLGALLGVIALLVRQEFLLFIMGGIFVVETLSVILQVGSFKLRGQRIFRMAPIHHHFELGGWPEPRVIVRFWIITFVLVLLGLITLKIR